MEIVFWVVVLMIVISAADAFICDDAADEFMRGSLDDDYDCSDNDSGGGD